jgi:hypothetical protein
MSAGNLTIPVSVQFPDLSDLPQRALATPALRSSEGRQLPKGPASALAGNFIRSFEVCVVSYERARNLVVPALDEGAHLEPGISCERLASWKCPPPGRIARYVSPSAYVGRPLPD